MLHAEPRLLVVKVAASRSQAILISIHGLDKDHGEAKVKESWKHFGDTIERCATPGDTIICGVDGNCRIGTNNGSDDSAVGTILDPLHRHNFVSDAFVRFARRIGLCITRTFEHMVSSGPFGSLHTETGIMLRCDYILTGKRCEVQAGSVDILRSFVIANVKPDHVPVAAVVIVDTSVALPVTRRRAAIYDRKAVRAAATAAPDDGCYKQEKEDVERYLENMPSIPADVGPSSHTFLLDEYRLHGLEQFFPPPRQIAKQSYIMNAIFLVVCEKNTLQHIMHVVGLKLKVSTLWFVVRFWAHVILNKQRPRWCFVRGPQSKAMCYKQYHLSVQVWSLVAKIKIFKADDFEALCMSQARNMEEAALEGCSRILFELLRKLRKFVPRREFRIHDSAGVPCGSDLEEREVVLAHFCEKLEGEPCTVQSLIDDDRSRCGEIAVRNKVIDLTVDAAPPIQSLTLQHARGKMN